jgi:hypothetical protein
MPYGPPNPDYLEGAAWLATFLDEHGLTPEMASHVLGVNQARVWEWLRQRRELPEEIRERLERWHRDGCPRFEYWDEYRYRHLHSRTR